MAYRKLKVFADNGSDSGNVDYTAANSEAESEEHQHYVADSQAPQQ